MIGKERDDYNEEFADLDGVIIPDEDGRYSSNNSHKSITIQYTLQFAIFILTVVTGLEDTMAKISC